MEKKRYEPRHTTYDILRGVKEMKSWSKNRGSVPVFFTRILLLLRALSIVIEYGPIIHTTPTILMKAVTQHKHSGRS